MKLGKFTAEPIRDDCVKVNSEMYMSLEEFKEWINSSGELNETD